MTDLTQNLLLAASDATGPYWPLRFLAVLCWALFSAACGMFIAGSIWSARGEQARQIEKENRLLTRERDDLERQLKALR